MEIILYLFLAVLGLGLISRILMAIWKVHFFGRDLGEAVKKKRPLWLQNSVQLLLYKPEELSILGVFLMFIWLLIVFLNVLLIAQVLELYFDTGTRFVLPLVGSYRVFPLIMGALLALCQTAFKLIFDRSDAKSMVTKTLLIVIIVVAVFTEAGLSAIRAWYLTMGREMASPTLWDMILLRGGPILAGFLGLIVPSAEIFTGAIAFTEGIEPLCKGVVRWIGGIIGLFWWGITGWVFGGQGSNLPITIIFLREEFRRVQNGLGELKIKSDALREAMNRLDRTPKDFQTLRKKNQEFEDDVKERSRFWDKGCYDLEIKINNATSLSDLENIKRKEMRNLQTQFAKNIRDAKNKINLLYDNIKEGCRDIRVWIKKCQRYNETQHDLQNELASINATYENLKKQADDIDRCFGEQESFKPEILTQPQVNQLMQLKRKAMDESNLSVKDRSLKEMQECLKVTTEIKGMADRLKGIIYTIEQMKMRIPDVIPVAPTKSEENDLKTEVLHIQNEITENHKERKLRFCDLKKDMKIKTKTFKRDKPWFRRFFVVLPLLIFLPLLNGCDKLTEQIKVDDTPHFIIVLIDETSSFKINDSGGGQFWPEVIPWVNKIIDSLQPGDGFGLIGIDAKGFETDDIRINLEVMNESMLKMQQQKFSLQEKVKKLTRREGAKATDILGALSHAAYLLNNLDKKYLFEVAIFSDMQHNVVHKSTESQNIFPEGTLGYCFYVNATGTGNWDKLINEWTPIFERVNLNVTRKDGKLNFYQRGEMRLGFENTFGLRK